MKKIVCLDKEFYTFILNNINKDTNALRLQMAGKSMPFDIALAIDQIEARKRTRNKLGSFNRYDKFLYPSVLASEQSTHELVARYNASLIEGAKYVVDMTAGLGIDLFTFANCGVYSVGIEMDRNRAAMLIHNAEVLGLSERVKIICEDSLQYMPRLMAMLKHMGKEVEKKEIALFIDPARRGDANSRTYFLEDCVPDITTHLDTLYTISDRILVKSSPILDISRAAEQLPGIKEAHTVSVDGEVKEVLLVLEHGYVGEVKLVAVNLRSSRQSSEDELPIDNRYELTISESGNNGAPIAEEADLRSGCYIYDPAPTIHKLSAGRSLCSRYAGLKRIGRNTDIYLSAEKIEDFPGRSFLVADIADSKRMKQLKGEGYSVISRNHPLSADNIKSKYKLKESQQQFLIAVRLGMRETPLLILAEQL